MIQKIIFFAKKIKISLANIRKQKNSNYSFLIKLEYLLISTLFSYNFFRFRSKKFKNTGKDIKKKEIFNCDEKSYLNKLERDGISKIFNLDKSICEKLINEIVFNINCLDKKYQNNHLKLVLKNKDIKLLINYLKIKNIDFIKYYINAYDSDSLCDVINSPKILNLAKNYLQTDKIYNRNELFITLKKELNSNDELKKSNQQFHIDLISKKFLKLFIYLSNVNDQNGAHIYLKRTHKNKPYVFSIPNYFSDNEVNNYSFENLKITGKIGTCFIEDTFGLHKAGYVNDGYRIMLAITYSKGKILWPHTSDNLIT